MKCHRYWTESFSEPYCFYKNYYSILKSKPIELEDCIIRNLRVKYSTIVPESLENASNNKTTAGLKKTPSSSSNVDSIDFEYDFTQIHLNKWPDHGVPTNIEPLINILSLVRQKMIENNKNLNQRHAKLLGMNVNKIFFPLSNDYLVVHCSAGCGRTGTIIAIDQLWNLLNENRLDEKNFSLYKIARGLREQRIAMIQTQSQYFFFSRAIGNLFEKYLKNYQEIQEEKLKQNKPKQNESDINNNNNNKSSLNDSVQSNTPPISPALSNSSSVNSSASSSQNQNNPNLKYKRSSSLAKYIDNTPLSTTMKQKISRFVPNVLNMFSVSNNSQSYSPNKTTGQNQNYISVLNNTPNSASPSPVSISSTNTSSSNNSYPNTHKHNKNYKTTRSTIETNMKDAFRMSSPLTTNIHTSNFSGQTQHRKVNAKNFMNEYMENPPRDTPTPTYTAPAVTPAGSVTEFLSSKFVQNDQGVNNAVDQQEKRSKSAMKIKQSQSNTDINEAGQCLGESNGSGVKLNKVKLSTSHQTDLRQINPPKKAEYYDNYNPSNVSKTMPANHHHAMSNTQNPKFSRSISTVENTENYENVEQSEQHPRAPLRFKVRQRNNNNFSSEDKSYEQQQQQDSSAHLKLVNMNLNNEYRQNFKQQQNNTPSSTNNNNLFNFQAQSTVNNKNSHSDSSSSNPTPANINNRNGVYIDNNSSLLSSNNCQPNNSVRKLKNSNNNISNNVSFQFLYWFIAIDNKYPGIC